MLAEDLKTLKPPLPRDTFLLRWPLAQAEFEKIEKAGTEVTADDTVNATPVTTPAGEKTDVSYLILTTKGKLVPIAYLQPRPPHEIRSGLEKDIVKGFAYQDWRLGTGRWWMGRVSPPEAAGVFLSLSWSQGEFAVCQPPEWEEEKKWAQFCLLVRTMTGDIDQIWHEWRETEYFNMRFAKHLGHERKQLYDVLPDQPVSPPHGLLYFIIQRTEMGDFFLEDGKEYNSIEKLLDHYYTNPLPMKEPPAKKVKANMVLRAPADVCKTPFSSPRPMLFPMKCPGYKTSPLKLVLSQKADAPLESYNPCKWKVAVQKRDYEEGEGGSKKGDKPKRDDTKRAYFWLDGCYAPVAVRELRKNFKRKAFEKDMTRIHFADGSKYAKAHNEVIKKDLKSPKFRPGYHFIAHIVAYGEKENWIAYEGINGLPLDRLLLKRRYDDWWMSSRTKLEVAYQVAAGMRFLEENYLCHRHLRAANVCVFSEHLGTMAVKITDYMVPYAYLDPDFVDEIDLADQEWPWWAPECLRFRCFDIISDIWAYGCLLFELVHFGMPPYSFENPKVQSAKDVARFFAENRKMKTLEGQELETYMDDIMQLCWRSEHNERPTFDHLYRFLRQLLFDATIQPEKTLEDFVGKAPKTFEHKWSRGKMKDRTA